MLRNSEHEEYLARRARLGFPVRTVVRKVDIPPPRPVKEEPKPYQYQRDWLFVGSVESPNTRTKTSAYILAATAKKYSVSIAEIKGQRRDKSIVKARHEVFYRMSKELGYSLTMIGNLIGGRDHTTVISGIQRHEARLVDPKIDDRNGTARK